MARCAIGPRKLKKLSTKFGINFTRGMTGGGLRGYFTDLGHFYLLWDDSGEEYIYYLRTEVLEK